jgi:serine/threonine-protein kinase HipA
LLSLGLPTASRPLTDTTSEMRVSAFLEGLLPEGNLRRVVATEAGIPTIDKMGLLQRVGAECAGAVQFLKDDHTPADGHVRPLSTSEVTRLVADLPTYHLPEGAYPQASLAGIQDKVLLTQTANGWGWPEQGAPSTHIIKPEPLGNAVIPHLVQSEHWALQVAQAAGLAAAESRLETFGGRQALVVTRYDRSDGGRRLHQEDFCQALGLDPESKYEAYRAGRATRLTELMKRASPRATSSDELQSDVLAAITFNAIIGNGDAHSKNYSLFISPQGRVSLTPLYDIAPVMFIDARFKSTGHVVNGVSSIDRLRSEDLLSEAQTWGLARSRALRVVASTADAVRDAVNTVALPDELADAVARLRQFGLANGWTAARSPRASSQPASESGPGEVVVRAYVNRKGTVVPGHTRTRPLRS